MKQKEAELLLVAARLLEYPNEENIQFAKGWIKQSAVWSDQQDMLNRIMEPLDSLPILELEKLYVNTFEFKAKTGLYLTAHEFGDSPKRGAALIRLQNIISQAGFQRVDDELADYIPMLYELVAVMEETNDTIRLWKRLGNVTQILKDQLPDTNPYYPLINRLMQDVFQAPTEEEIIMMEQNREKADLEELPYPIMYN